MERSLLLNPDMNDLVFEGRNKAYGAFVLRHDYEGNMARGMLVGLLFFVLCVLSPFAYYYFKSDIIVEEIKIICDFPIVNLQEFEKTPVIKKPEAASSLTPQQPKPQIKFVPPVVVADNEDVPEEAPPGIDELKNNDIGSVTIKNENGTVSGDLVPDEPGTGIANDPAPEPDVFNSYAVEQQPEFPNGLEAMYKFLRKNLVYTSLAKENGISGTVFIQFVISKEGNIENAKVVRGIGGGLDQEALRVVKMMPSWKPGKHNGKSVAVNFTLPIKFELLK